MNSSRRQFLARSAVAGAAVVAGGTFASSPVAALAAVGTTRITALTGVTVIDVATSHRAKHQTVLISGDRIIGVGRNLPVPRGATELDLTGKFVIPGLADMHVHSLGDEHVSPPLYLANGLTTVREMAAPDPVVYGWRDRIDAGTLLGPRMIVASQIIDGDPTLWNPNLLHVLVVNDEACARAAVRQVKAEGADFVKVYSRLSPTAYRAILDEARRKGLTVHGHGPDQVSVKQVSNAGQRSIEHIHASRCRCPAGRPRYAGCSARSRSRPATTTAGSGRCTRSSGSRRTPSAAARAADVFGTLRRNRTRVTRR